MVRFWNPAAERVFGYAAADVIGGDLYVLIPEQFREAHDRGFARALAAGETKYAGQALPTKARHAAGRDIYVELSFSIVRGSDGSVIGALAHARDITERFSRDREMRRRLRALEQELQALRGDDGVPDAAEGVRASRGGGLTTIGAAPALRPGRERPPAGPVMDRSQEMRPSSLEKAFTTSGSAAAPGKRCRAWPPAAMKIGGSSSGSP